MSVTELKSLAYDQLVMIENIQKNLVAINQEIARKTSAAPLPETKKKDE